MSNLRIAGLIIGIVGLLSTFLIYRGPKWKRSNFILFSLCNLFMIVVTINPNAVNFVRDALSLREYLYGRLIALLIMSNIFLLFFSFYTKAKVENVRLQFDRLVRSHTLSDVEKVIASEETIKPIMILVPAYNESENLKELLPRIPEQVDGIDVGILVIDDGSEDSTLSVAAEAGAWAVKNPINRGGGAALRLGYDILRKSGVEFCVTMDGDGQHRPEEIEKLIHPVIKGQYDIVIGSRVLGHAEKDSLFRLTGVYIFSGILFFLIGKKITDPSSGFRAFKMNCLNEIGLYEDQYHTSELIISAVKSGRKIGEVPVTMRRRRHGKSKKGKDWAYGINFAKTIVRTWWR
ncbi:MAG: DUF2304 family protein [Thermodesulfobacteriota bacterium]|nr:DUF2304 family protein [Thermodesulfobacteriota bacterium]